jgi:hypothetical protein
MSHRSLSRGGCSICREIQRRRDAEVPVDCLGKSSPALQQPNPPRPSIQPGEEPEQIPLHIPEQIRQREPRHHDVLVHPPATPTVWAAVLPHAQIVPDDLDLGPWAMAQPRRIPGKHLHPIPPVLQTRTTAGHHREPGDAVGQSQATSHDQALLGEQRVHYLIASSGRRHIKPMRQRGHEQPDFLIGAPGIERQPRPRRHRRYWPRLRRPGFEDRNLNDGLQADHRDSQPDPPGTSRRISQHAACLSRWCREGWYVDVLHTGQIITRYCHMLTRPSVAERQHVVVGQVIGLVGSSGHSSGPHLHLEAHTSQPANSDNAVEPVEFFAARRIDLTEPSGD